MSDATGRVHQAGKRPQPEDGFGTSASGKAADALPMAAVIRPRLDKLGLEIIGELARWLDARALARLENCSKQLCNDLRQLRWISAGPLILGTRYAANALEKRRASDQWLTRQKAKALPMSERGNDRSGKFPDTGDSEAPSLRAIGWDAGRRFDHIHADHCHPLALEGIVQASGWRSLSVCFDRSRLQQGLDALANSLVCDEPLRQRELSLQISGCNEKSDFRYPGKFRAKGLDLVDLYLEDVTDPENFLCCFTGEASLLRLGVDVDRSVNDPAIVVKTIVNAFPELVFFELLAHESFAIAPDIWSSFHMHHPKIAALSIRHLHLGLKGMVPDFGRCCVRELTLQNFFPSDPDGCFAAWIKGSYTLQTLEIELEAADFESSLVPKLLVRDRLLEAIAASPTLSKLSLKGSGWTMGGAGGQPCELLLSLLDSLAMRAGLTDLQIPAFGIGSFEDLLNSAGTLRASRLMSKLEHLERQMPTLRLTLGEYVLGSVCQEVLEFKVRMPTWGDGAFRRFIDFCTLRPEARNRHLIGLAIEVYLVSEGSPISN